MSLRHCLTAMPPLLKRRGFPLCTSKALLSRRAVSEQRELTERSAITVATPITNSRRFGEVEKVTILLAVITVATEAVIIFSNNLENKSQYCLQLSLLQPNALAEALAGKEVELSQYCLQLSLLQHDVIAIFARKDLSHNTACSYHCCNGY